MLPKTQKPRNSSPVKPGNNSDSPPRDIEHQHAREIHHRVKNNLQIVSSLLSLHARDAENNDVARAYTAMQMRVNALSCVHRWLFDEPERSGVNSVNLLGDLTASLERGVENIEGITTVIDAKIGEIIITQDIAVPLAFLITEVVGYAGSLAAASARKSTLVLGMTFSAKSEESDCYLTITGDVFIYEDPFSQDNQAASARIVKAMIRQLRGTLVHAPKSGTYTIAFPAQMPGESQRDL